MIRCFNCRALRPANAQGPLIGAARPDGMGSIPGKAGYADYSRHRGVWVLDRMPVAINALLRPDDFVGKHIEVRDAPHFGTVTGRCQRGQRARSSYSLSMS